jgi:hypothetical protein
MGRKPRRLGGQAHRDDHFARPENVLAVGFAARQEVEHLKRNFAPACSALDLDDGVVRDQGTQKSEGWVAMQCSLQPKTACSRLSPPRASHPTPGVRLLQALATS